MAKYVGYKRPKDTKKTKRYEKDHEALPDLSRSLQVGIFPCGNSCIYQCGGRNLRHISDQTVRQQFHCAGKYEGTSFGSHRHGCDVPVRCARNARL